MSERTLFRPRPNNLPCRAMVMLPDQLTTGCSIRIRGYIPDSSSRFAINLQRGEGLYDDNINLHFDVRFEQNAVVRNHLVQQRRGSTAWGDEEREGELPFTRNSRFEAIFTMEEHLIRMTVNGAPFTTFYHRLPMSDITHISVVGDCQIRFISFEEGF